MPPNDIKVYGTLIEFSPYRPRREHVKDLSFILPVLDHHWMGLTVRPSLTGNVVTRVSKHLVVDAETKEVAYVWWQVELGHVPWNIRPTHPVDAWLLEVATRHS
jgi:hypothetical protein